MKKLLTTTCLLLLVALASKAQQTQSLPSFSKIVISPKIELELIAGESESITWEAFGVDEESINIEVKGNKLKIYLDNAKIAVMSKEGSFGWRYPMYDKHVLVKAKVTYNQLKRLEVRGEEAVNISSDLQTDKKFTLKAYGASNIKCAGVSAEKFKAILIGENELEVLSGLTPKQKIKSIGQNTVDFSALKSYRAKTSTIGEGLFHLNVRDFLHISAIGESVVQIKGSPAVSKGLIIGENSFYGN